MSAPVYDLAWEQEWDEEPEPLTAAVQAWQFHGTPGDPDYPHKPRIDKAGPALREAIRQWKIDPYYIHEAASDILNGTTSPGYEMREIFRGRKVQAVLLLRAMMAHSTRQPPLYRGVMKKRIPEEIEAEFAVGKEFTLAPRGFSSKSRTAQDFLYDPMPGTDLGTRVFFRLKAGAKALSIEPIYSPTYDENWEEAERIVAGTFRVEKITTEESPVVVTIMIDIVQTGFIEEPPGGFK